VRATDSEPLLMGKARPRPIAGAGIIGILVVVAGADSFTFEWHFIVKRLPGRRGAVDRHIPP
jgi:hypothetical protein